MAERTSYFEMFGINNKNEQPTLIELLVFLVRVTGLEPVRSISPRDFKSLASANFAIPAKIYARFNF